MALPPPAAIHPVLHYHFFQHKFALASEAGAGGFSLDILGVRALASLTEPIPAVIYDFGFGLFEAVIAVLF